MATYLSLGVDKIAGYNATLTGWSQSRDQAAHVFTKQALAMVWDYAEVNPFARAAGDLGGVRK
jgi:putative DNA methylase